MNEDALHRLICMIYDAALEPELPLEVLAQISSLTGSTAVTADLITSKTRIMGTRVLGTDPSFRSIANELSAYNLHIQRAHVAREGRAILGQQFAPLEDWEGNPCLYEVLIPAKTVHLMALPYSLSPDAIGNISVWRDLSDDPHGTEELRIGHLIAEHLRRAFRFGQRFLEAADLALGLQTALDRLAVGCLLIEADGRLVQANAAAAALLDRRGALRLKRGRVEADRANAAVWRRMLASLAPAQGTPVGAIVALDRPEGPLLLHAVPLRPQQGEHWGVPLRAPLGMVMLIEPDRTQPPHHQMLAAAFGLTPAEAELAEALLHDESLADYAERRGRSRETVRVQLRSLFAKTGTHRQSALVHRLAAVTVLAGETPQRSN